MKIISYLFCLLIAFGAMSCIDPYSLDFNQKNSVLVVEGFLTDDSVKPDTIKIQYSNFENEVVSIVPIASVKASVLNVETNEETKLIEQPKGGFLPPKNFKIKIQNKYILKFSLPNGQNYESAPETITPTPAIAKVYDIFNPKSVLSEDGKKYLSANEVYLDTQDPSEQKNYYLWRYIHFERLGFCITCTKSQYSVQTGACSIPLANFNRTAYYDYQCAGDCFSIFKSKQVSVLSDVASNGQLIKGKLIAKIPNYSPTGCLIQIQQISISPEMFLYFKILEAQTQSNGGLADTPPAGIVGNIKNITTPTEKVVGYFGVVSIQKSNYWIDRKDAKSPYELILGHEISVENSTADTSRPPFAPCTASSTRTPIKPDGWQ
ncbi:DUF4249 domain-containing protein [Arcicella sp. LKC2W]|uniref:DUF4249 domain-containing protein n=1 Tax=Arcicella sp. LKC2W TaxID=2984198 RepID=UPI002B1F6187|nr:DUF4249 domain-containing protein [Arcicella sp. LKC2W]MEA5460125.1 DUF4249 domain-containing protein [Arcicella sp. LKC2W]